MADQNTKIMESEPLTHFTKSPKLLLKQWLKEQQLILNRVSNKETQIDSIRKEITQLYCFFFLFHSTALVLLFTASSSSLNGGAKTCRRSWIPSLCSLLCSLGIMWAVRYKTDVENHLENEFDLLKEVDVLRKALLKFLMKMKFDGRKQMRLNKNKTKADETKQKQVKDGSSSSINKRKQMRLNKNKGKEMK